MIPAAVRYVVARLTDPSTGVNALLASVPRPDTDAAPDPVGVLNDMDNGLTALGPLDGTLVADGPVLCVSAHQVAQGVVQVAVRYAAPATADATTVVRDGWTTLRAAERAARTRPAGADTAQHRTRVDGVTLGPVTDVLPFPPPPGSAEAAYAPALLVLVPASDTWARATA